jgi:hypothetical protein
MNPASRSIDDAVTAALMVQYGITRSQPDIFHLGKWRFARLADAIAQARRIAASAEHISQGRS